MQALVNTYTSKCATLAKLKAELNVLLSWCLLIIIINFNLFHHLFDVRMLKENKERLVFNWFYKLKNLTAQVEVSMPENEKLSKIDSECVEVMYDLHLSVDLTYIRVFKRRSYIILR